MMGGMAVRPLLVGCAWLSLCASSTAYAYCRTHTKDPPASSCPEVCTERGLPLSWASPDLVYTFNEELFPGIPEAQLRSIFAASFQAWENVRCDGEPVGLDIRARTATTPLGVGADGNNARANTNVIVHLDPQAWAEEDNPAQAFAITAVWFNPDTGEIVGSDIEFNGGMDPFGECPDSGCTSASGMTDLRNVATHEIGHFLGLSHSDVPLSTMWCDAQPVETVKRSLSPDDIKGLCAVYPPESAFRGQVEKSSSCGVGGTAPGSSRGLTGGLAGLLTAALGLGLRRRRRT